MSDNLFDLYSQKILDLAMDIPHLSPLQNWDGEASERSAICGSQISVRIKTEGDKVIAYSQEVKTCALGQASSAIFGKNVLGQSFDQIVKLVHELDSFLKKNGPAPSPPFSDYALLAPAQDYKNRHASILLAPKATVSAIKKAAQK